MSEWTEERIQKIQDILSCYPASRFQDALKNISKEFGRSVTSASLRGLFQRKGLPSPTSFCLKADAHPVKGTVSKGRIHVVIGDTQVKPGVPTAHLRWIGQYLVDHFADQDIRLIHVGDHWDMPSLSSYDKGKGAMEGRRYRADIDAGNRGMDLLMTPIEKYNQTQKKKGKAPWIFSKEFLLGNHEERIARAVEDNIQLEGMMGYDDFNLEKWGWNVHPFLKPVELEGIDYCHYFYHPNTGKPFGGENLETRLKTIGRSFTQGHQQGLKVATRYVGNRRHQGLVIGSTYLHDENYLGFQGNACWRGIMICHQVENGQYDRMEVSLDFLCRRYEGVDLAEYMRSIAT